MQKRTFFRDWLIFSIVSFSIMLYPLAIGLFSLLMLLCLFLSSVFVFSFYISVSKKEIPLYLLLLGVIFLPLIHWNSFRFSTVAYSAIFILTFICYRRFLRTSVLSKNRYLGVVQKIIYAYFFVLILQQLSVFVGIPVFNQCWKFPNPFKLNSLAHEPSYIGGTLALFMFSYAKLWKEGQKSKFSQKNVFWENKKLWLAFSYVMLTCGSSWTLMAFALIFAYFLWKERMWKSILLSLFAGICGLIYFGSVEVVKRWIDLMPAIVTGNTEIIGALDLSAAARINPVLYYFQDFNIFSFNTWFGYGVDYSKTHTIVRLLDSYDYMEQGNATGGLFPAFFLDYGLIGGGLFLWNLKKFAVKRICSFLFILWLFCFLPIGFNTYMTWLFFIISYSTNYFLQREVQ